MDTPAPAVCPYCGKPLDQSEETRPVADEFPPPSQEEIGQRLKKLYNRHSMLVSAVLFTIAFLILGWAIFEQIRSFSNFWYKGILIAVYSIIAGFFVITRFLFAFFYHAPADDPNYNPSVTVLVPCFNEGEAIRKTLERIFSSGYPEEQLEVVCVNDGSRDDSWEHILEAQSRHPRLDAVNFERNRGLCHGWGVGIALARGEFMVCVDSDTFVFPNSLHKLLQGFKDPEVGGISGHCDIERADVNTLTRLQDVRYYFSYKIMKAAESIFGTVSCLPGCFSAYRRSCVAEVANQWINSTVWGEHGNFADDRSLTNLILRNHKIIYDDEALATTICPEKWGQYIRQQARWQRSYLREIWKTGKFIWRKHPVPALSWYAMMWMPLVEPIVMLQALVILPVSAYRRAFSENFDYLDLPHISEAPGFMDTVADKIDYSVISALASPVTLLGLSSRRPYPLSSGFARSGTSAATAGFPPSCPVPAPSSFCSGSSRPWRTTRSSRSSRHADFSPPSSLPRHSSASLSSGWPSPPFFSPARTVGKNVSATFSSCSSRFSSSIRSRSIFRRT